MRTQIDTLVREFRHCLTQPLPADEQLAAALIAVGMDGATRAAKSRDVLASYVEDERLAIEHRQYAQQQLEALPAF